MTATPDGERGWVDLDRLAGWFRDFGEADTKDLPLYRSISVAMSEDRSLLEVMTNARAGQWRPVLFFAALHFAVLEHPEHELSAFYPSVTGRAAPARDPVPALRRFMTDHVDELAELIATRSTQTNEVNRSCLWFVALRHAASDPTAADRPIALLEIGASAGLNLHVDEYRYDFGDGSVRGVATSPVSLACDVVAGAPPLDAALPPIVDRRGLDLLPIDPSDATEARWLKACVWAEQLERHRRLDAALAHAIAHPVPIVRDDAIDGLSDAIDSFPDDAHAVVVNSWVMTYIAKDRRAAFESVLDLAGSNRLLTWVSAEGSGVVPSVIAPAGLGSADTVVGMSRWRDGERRDEVVAICHPHLRWLDWRA